jgi:hypothetical protein
MGRYEVTRDGLLLAVARRKAHGAPSESRHDLSDRWTSIGDATALIQGKYGRPRRGPVPGKLRRYAESDRALFPEMVRIIREQRVSPTEAARQLVEKIRGSGCEDSKVRRLAKAYSRAEVRSPVSIQMNCSSKYAGVDQILTPAQARSVGQHILDSLTCSAFAERKTISY